MSNPFSKNYRPQIKLQPDWRTTQLHNAPKAKREKIVLADGNNQIHITSKEESLKTQNIKHVRI